MALSDPGKLVEEMVRLKVENERYRGALEWVDEYINRYVIVSHASIITGTEKPNLNGDNAEQAMRRKIREALQDSTVTSGYSQREDNPPSPTVVYPTGADQTPDKRP